MTQKCKVLWIEDGARFDFQQLAAPVYIEGYDLVVAEDVTSALALLRQSEYGVVIVDIRLLPGDDPEWIRLYKKARLDKAAARLGLELLKSLLGSARAKVRLKNRPLWLTANRIGILTVENRVELREDLDELGIQAYQRKQAGVPDTVLLNLIKRVEQKA